MGRGSSGISSSGALSGGMNVDYDKWGKILDGADIVTLYDDEGSVIGKIEDELRFIEEPDIHKATKAEVLNDIEAWKNDDGTYGDEDTSIIVAYDDGTFYSNEWTGGKYRTKLKKSGVIGASISTAGYEMVWGGERDKNGKFSEWQTWSEDGKSGRSNSYSGYKTVGQYRVRVKTTYNNKRENGTYYTKRETIRKSKVKEVRH